MMCFSIVMLVLRGDIHSWIIDSITFQDQWSQKTQDLEIGSPNRRPLIFRGEVLVSGRVCFLLIVFYVFFYDGMI